MEIWMKRSKVSGICIDKAKEEKKVIFISFHENEHSLLSTAPAFNLFFVAAFRVLTAANCNVLIAERISLPVALHKEDSEVPMKMKS